MKRNYLILLFSFAFRVLFAQAPAEGTPKSVYQVLRHEVVTKGINFVSRQIDSTALVLFDDVVFIELDEIQEGNDSYTLIRTVQHVKNRKPIIDPLLKSVEIGKYYVVTTKSLKNNTDPFTPKTWEVRAGIVNIPVKFYLPNDGDPIDFSSKSVSLGTSIGIARQVSNSKSNLWINYLVGAQFTMVTPTQDDFLNFSSTSSDNTLSAFSFSLGIALNFDGIEAGIFVGKDFLPGSASKDWKHNGDTWFSFGIGTNLSNGKQRLTNY